MDESRCYSIGVAGRPAKMKVIHCGKVFAAALLLMACRAGAQSFACSTNADNTITIISYYGPSGAVSIPNTLNGMPVTTIAKSLLAPYGGGATSVSVPSSVTNIGSGAFGGYEGPYHGLTGVTVDPANAFYSSAGGVLFNKDQTVLLQVPGGFSASHYAVPNGVTSIDTRAFIGTTVTDVTMPASVTNVGDQAFFLCDKVTAITVDPANLCYSSTNGVLFDKNQRLLIYYPHGNSATSYTMPDSVWNVAAYAFYQSEYPKTLKLGNSVTNIGDRAFYGTGVSGITFPGSVASIGSYAFAFSGLSTVTLGAGLKTINGAAFASCLGLMSVVIPASVTNLADTAFSSCYNLRRILFLGSPPGPDSLSNLEYINNQILYRLPGQTGWEAAHSAVLWNPQAQTGGGSFGVRSNVFGFNITGTADIPIVVEGCTNLNGGWSPLLTGTVTNGLIYFSDPAWMNHPSGFYRIGFP